MGGRHRRRRSYAGLRQVLTAAAVCAAALTLTTALLPGPTVPGPAALLATPPTPRAGPLIGPPPVPVLPVVPKAADLADTGGKNPAPSTSEAPATTAEPAPTTETPATTTDEEPHSVTIGPEWFATTTGAPAETTDPPAETTVANPTTTEPPAATRDAPATTTAPPVTADTCSAALDGAEPHVAAAGLRIATETGVPVGSIIGRGTRAGNPNSDHPAGRAFDFMVDRRTGDRVADYALAHRAELGVTYVLWRQRYNDGSGWDPMEDRGGPTADHYDHVHISFDGAPGAGC